MIVYFNIKFGCQKDDDTVKKTIKYRKAFRLAEYLGCKVQYDITSTFHNKYPVFEKLLKSKKDHTIAIADVSALGNCDEIPVMYEQIIQSGKGLLVAAITSAGTFKFDEQYSTIAFEKNNPDDNYSIVSDGKDNIMELKTLTTSKVKKMAKGAPLSFVSPEFKRRYWMVECKEGIKLSDLYEKFNCSKNTFLSLVREYEDSDGYREDLKKLISQSGVVTQSIVDIPKVINTIPQWIKDYNAYRELGYSKERAKQTVLPSNVPDDEITDIIIKRCELRLEQIEKNLRYRKDIYPKEK